jgi:hypothetical protein
MRVKHWFNNTYFVIQQEFLCDEDEISMMCMMRLSLITLRGKVRGEYNIYI